MPHHTRPPPSRAPTPALFARQDDFYSEGGSSSGESDASSDSSSEDAERKEGKREAKREAKRETKSEAKRRANDARLVHVHNDLLEGP